MNNIKMKQDNNSWVRDLLKDKEFAVMIKHKETMSKRTETRRLNAEARKRKKEIIENTKEKINDNKWSKKSRWYNSID